MITIPFAKYTGQKKITFAIAHFHPAVFRRADDNTRAAVRVAVDSRPVFILRRLSFGSALACRHGGGSGSDRLDGLFDLYGGGIQIICYCGLRCLCHDRLRNGAR